MQRDKFYDYGMGEHVPVRWFGDIIQMEVIGHDEPSKQVQVGHLNANGSFFITPAEIIENELTLKKMEQDEKPEVQCPACGWGGNENELIETDNCNGKPITCCPDCGETDWELTGHLNSL